jgi:hypothetical protein
VAAAQDRLFALISITDDSRGSHFSCFRDAFKINTNHPMSAGRNLDDSRNNVILYLSMGANWDN